MKNAAFNVSIFTIDIRESKMLILLRFGFKTAFRLNAVLKHKKRVTYLLGFTFNILNPFAGTTTLFLKVSFSKTSKSSAF